MPALLVLGLALSGCGSKAPVADAGLEIAAPAEQRLIALTDLDQRVARVGYRLSAANAELCPAVRNSAGWLLHAASQYSPELRPHAEARFGLDGDLPGLLAVPEGSAAARAGLRRGDLLLGINGEALARGVTRRAAAFEGVEANIQKLDLALAAGPVEIAFRRDGDDQTATVTPQRACGYDVQLDPSDELNARADGKRLYITTAMAGFTATDDELAIVLGHELAHHVLGHRGWHEAEARGRQTQTLPAFTSAAGGAERQADRVGLYLAARAGFDTGIAPAFWRRFGDYNWRVRYPGWSHPSAEARARALEAVQAELSARRASGQPLVP
ncbi:M48 family metalloprotease [Brevundimonas sp. UBA2416]|uniref:M48 family metalloprotease n=1 Tax=Brevundimonas sp. UBA2416 TaxID=1946124 RepID=UPI0025BF2421|nr:M48 family metalloprotease [Brevundimonas sp. UBA2416]